MLNYSLFGAVLNGTGGRTRTDREITLRQILNLMPRPFGYTRIILCLLRGSNSQNHASKACMYTNSIKEAHKYWSVWQDLNLRPPTSKADRLTRLTIHTDYIPWRRV